MNKKLLFLFYSFISLFLLSACGGDDGNEDTPPTPVKKTLSVVKTSIAAGEEIDATTTALSIEYNTNVKLAANTKVTVNGQSVAATNGSTMRIINVSLALKPGTAYTVSIPAGGVVATADANTTSEAFTLTFSTKKEASEDLPDNDAMKVTRMIGFGWNLGNHFDSYDGNNAAANYRITWSKDCPYWDNVNPTADLYKKLAAAGVKTVRIPVTWGPYEDMTDGKYTIDADYMATVKKNVLWAKAAGLNVVLNTHHDEYWQDAYSASLATQPTKNAEIKARIEATWKQIAEAFKEEGEYLILESFNELNHNWANPTAGELRIQNEWNQLVVDVIRATGGQNATRWIAVPTYQANAGQALKSTFVVPNDPAKKIIVAVHCYDPYNFTLQDPFGTEVWGHKSGNANDEKNITDLFANLKKNYIDKNIPIYLGEFGCSRHTGDKANKCRDYYLEYFCRAAYSYGLAGCIWDNNVPGSGPEHHAYFNHKDGSWQDGHETIVKTMIKALTSTDKAYTLESIYNKAP